MDTTFVPPSPNSLEPIPVQTQGFVPPPPESIEPAATPAIGSPPPISTFSGSFPSAMSVPPPRPFNRYLQLAAENPTVPGMEKIGGVAPGVPKPPEPPLPLETDLQMNPLVPEGQAGVARPFLNMMGRGAGQAMSGVESMAEPIYAYMSDAGTRELQRIHAVSDLLGSTDIKGKALDPGQPALTPELVRQGAGGLHQTIGGAMGLATPLLMGATAAAPLRTGATLGIFSGAQQGVEQGLQALGLPPEYAGVAGDLAGFLAGAAAHRLLPPEQANLKSTLIHRMADKVATGEPTETATPPPEQQQFSITGQPIRQAGVEAKPEPPTKTKIVTAETPNPATASLPTVKESDATLAIQTQQLLNGTRRVVMFSHGEGQPADAPGPPGLIGVTHGSVPGMNGLPKNTYWYRTDLIYPSEIHRAEKMNDLNSVLGPTTGLDTPDNSQIPEGSPVVTTRAADGTEVQATATPVENVLQTASAHQPLVPPGGATTVEGPDGILQDRATQGVAPNPTQNVVNEPQLSTGTPPPTGSPMPTVGWRTPVEPGAEELAELQSAGLPRGTFYSLDRPFESDIHDPSKAVKTQIPPVINTFDPDGLLDSANRATHGAIYREMIHAINRAKLLNMGAMRDAMSKFLISHGFDSYVRGIDGDSTNRELIVFKSDAAGSPVEPPHVANIELSRTYEDPGTNSTFYGYSALDQNGVPLAEVKLWDNHDGTAMVDVVTNPAHPQAVAGENSAGALKIGPGEVRQALAFIQRQHPDIKKLEFERVGKPNPPEGRSINLREPKAEKGTSGELFRGAWDVPLNDTGRQQVALAAQRTAGKFTRIIGGTLGRHAETMTAFAEANPQAGPPEVSEEFDPMHMGNHEGEKVTPERLQQLNEHIVNHFDEPLPGVGQHSGLPGEVPASWFSRLIDGVQREMEAWKPGQRTLIVTSGRDIQAVRAWAAAGFKGLDPDVLTAKWKTEPGEMVYLDPRTGELSDVNDAAKDGVYIVRHGTTDANGGTGQPKAQSSPEALFTSGPSTRQTREAAAQFVRKVSQNDPTATPAQIVERVGQASTPEPPTGDNRLPPEGRSGPAAGTPANPSATPETAAPAPGPAVSGPNGPELGTAGSAANRVTQFLKEETGESELQKVPDELRRVFAPQTRGEEAREAAGALRNMTGERMLRMDRAKALFEKFRNHFYKNEPEELGIHGMNVIDAIEAGDLTGLNHQSREFAEAAHEAYEDRAQQLVQRGLVSEDRLIQEYFTHQYEDTPAARSFAASWMARRPMAGSESFRKQRVFPTLREALEAELKPKYDNPVDYVLSGLSSMDRSITAHDVFDEWKQHKYLIFVRTGQKYPTGFAPVNDRIFTVYGPRKGAVKLPGKPTIGQAKKVNITPEDVEVIGRREMGHYAAPEPMAQVANNWLSPNLQKYSAFKLWMHTKGAMNALNLSFSYFHALTTGLNSSFSDLSLALKYAAEGKLQEAAALGTEAFVPFASVITDAIRGRRLMSVWDGTAQNVTPEEYATVDALVKAGLGPHQSDFNPDRWWNSVRASYAKGESGKALAKMFNPLLYTEQFMKPLMQKLVPWAKMAVAEKAILFEAQKHPNMSFTESRERFGKVADSVDNRFGQLNQGNMFMNNIMRDVMNGIVGRPGWTLGTIRELLPGAIFDPIQQARDWYNDRPVEMSHRTAYFLAAVIGTAYVNGVMTYLMTGDKPKGKDFIAFRDGGTTEDGSPSRMVVGSYISKDVYSWLTNPLSTAEAKLAPPLTALTELEHNRDFYRHKIYGEGGQGVGKWAATKVLPYSATGIMRNRENAAPIGKSLAPLLGVMPAPRSMTLSPARSYLSDFMREHSDMIRANPSDHSRAMTQVIVSAHKDPEAAQRMGDQFVTEGKMSDRDVKSALNRAGKQPIVGELEWAGGLNQYTQLSYANVTAIVNAYDKANKTEREQIDGALKGKIHAKLSRVRNEPWKWTDNTRELAAKYFDVQPDIGSPPPIR